MAANEVLTLLNTIRGEMATKTDMARFHREVDKLRAENEAQTNQFRCLRTDVVNLQVQVQDLHERVLEEAGEAIKEVRDDVWRCCDLAQQEARDEAARIKERVEVVVDRLSWLELEEEAKYAEAEELNGDFSRMMKKIGRVEGKVNALVESDKTPKRDSGVSFGTGDEQKTMTAELWFANGN